MTLEQLIEQARKKRSPVEQARIDTSMRERRLAIDKRLSREFKDSIVTQEQLNKVISL